MFNGIVGKWFLAAKHDPEAEAKGENISSQVNRMRVAQLFRGGVAGGSPKTDGCLMIRRVKIRNLAIAFFRVPLGKEDAEVGYFQQGIFGDQDILGFDVAMDNATLVGKFHAVTELNGQRQGGAEISATTGLDPVGKISTVDKFNEKMGDFVDAKNIKTGGDIGMHSHSDPAVGFLEYSAHALTVREDFRAGGFDRHLYFPAEMFGDINVSHGSGHNLFDMITVKNGVSGSPDRHLRDFRRGGRLRGFGGCFPWDAGRGAFFPLVYLVKESGKHPSD
jgi:hypothetical protein